MGRRVRGGLLVVLPGGCAAPTYSPDGTSILFNTHGDGNDLVEGAWIMDRDGGNPRQFEPIPKEGASFVRWWGG